LVVRRPLVLLDKHNRVALGEAAAAVLFVEAAVADIQVVVARGHLQQQRQMAVVVAEVI
jgi:hypothetical protein